MNEQLISFETAKLAKEKRFSEYGDYFYTEEDGLCLIDSDGEILNIYDENLKQVDYRYDCNGNFWYKDHDNDLFESYIPIKYIAPTQSLLQKWLREKHNIIVWVSYIKESAYPYMGCIVDLKQVNKLTSGFRETYEEALENGLLKALKLI